MGIDVGLRDKLDDALVSLGRLVRHARDDAERIGSMKRIGRSALRVHRVLQQRPLASAGLIARLSGVSIPAVNTSLAALVDAGIVREVTGRKRDRVFSYTEYLRILTEGTEPLQSP